MERSRILECEGAHCVRALIPQNTSRYQRKFMLLLWTMMLLICYDCIIWQGLCNRVLAGRNTTLGAKIGTQTTASQPHSYHLSQVLGLYEKHACLTD